jgi:glutamyl-tRNA reductase
VSAFVMPRAASVIAFVAHARRVPSERREAFAAELAALEPSPGLIVVRTCHRAEAYIAPGAHGDRPLPLVPPGGHRLEDADAVRHLVSVACGLDSAVFGEDQILHQLRETLAERHAGAPLDPLLDRLFQVALGAGRRARAWFSGPPRSLADAALDRIADRGDRLDGRTILVVGVGRMGRLAAFAASRRGAAVLVANRTADRAEGLAREVGGTPVSLDADGGLPRVDGVIVAIGGSWRLGSDDQARLGGSGAIVVDLSSPPAVPPSLPLLLGDRFSSVDELAQAPANPAEDRLRRRLEALVSDAGADYCRWLRGRDTVPAIQAMAATAERNRRNEVDWLVRRLPGLSEDERSAVEQMSHRLVAGLLHGPLKALTADPDGDLERAARELFGL